MIGDARRAAHRMPRRELVGLGLAVDQPIAQALLIALEVVMLGELLDSQP